MVDVSLEELTDEQLGLLRTIFSSEYTDQIRDISTRITQIFPEGTSGAAIIPALALAAAYTIWRFNSEEPEKRKLYRQALIEYLDAVLTSIDLKETSFEQKEGEPSTELH